MVIERNFLGLIEQGGMVMLPLLLCSVVSVAIILERTWALSRGARAARRLHELVREALKDGARTEALAVCRRDGSPLSPVYRALLTAPAGERDSGLQLAQRKLGQVNRALKRFVWLLGTIGSLAPFIGLFGTVVGIVRAFENMAATGSGGFAVVAAGISEALIATAGGLLVGVIAIFAYNALMVRINNLTAELREHAEELLLQLEPVVAEGAVPRVVQSR